MALAAPGYGDANAVWESASYIKDSAGRVYLRGLLFSNNGVVKAAGKVLASMVSCGAPTS